MQLDDNSIQLVITFLEKGDESALNTYINLSLFPDEDKNEDFTELIASIKTLKVIDLKAISNLLSPKKSKIKSLEFLENIRSKRLDNQQELDGLTEIEKSHDPVDEILNQIHDSKYLDNTEKNVLSSFYDLNLMDNYTRLLSKKVYYHILKTAQFKFYLYNLKSLGIILF